MLLCCVLLGWPVGVWGSEFWVPLESVCCESEYIGMISGVIVPRREESDDVFETQHCHCVPLMSSWAGGGGCGQESFGTSGYY